MFGRKAVKKPAPRRRRRQSQDGRGNAVEEKPARRKGLTEAEMMRRARVAIHERGATRVLRERLLETQKELLEKANSPRSICASTS